MARSYPNNRPHALRESALLAAMGGRARAARRRFDASLRIAEAQGARHEHALTLQARGLVGLELGWAEAVTDVAHARQALADLAPTAAPSSRPSDDGEVTLSLLDRFDTLLSVGQQIASALTPVAVYTAVREAALTLLRAEDCAVLGLDDDDPATTHRPRRHERPLRPAGPGGPGVGGRAAGGPGDRQGRTRATTPRSAPRLCAPVFNRGRPVACCYLTHGQVGALFGEEEVRLAEFIATLAGTALENAEGFAEVQALSRSLERRVEARTTELAETNRQLTERSEAVALLKTIAVATNEASTVEDALQVALDEVCRHTGWPVGHVWRTADDVSGVTVTHRHLASRRPRALRRAPPGHRVDRAGPSGPAFPAGSRPTRTPVWIPDVLVDADFPRAACRPRASACGPASPYPCWPVRTSSACWSSSPPTLRPSTAGCSTWSPRSGPSWAGWSSASGPRTPSATARSAPAPSWPPPPTPSSAWTRTV